jgi:RHS repeat-associated protein
MMCAEELYGRIVEGEGFGSPFTFTGELLDANDLLYLRARYHSPALGVFTALDPVENLNQYQYVGANPTNDAVGEPMSLNRYSYVAGNPTNFVDPSGMIMESPGRFANCTDGSSSSEPCCGPDVGVWFAEELAIHRAWVEPHFDKLWEDAMREPHDFIGYLTYNATDAYFRALGFMTHDLHEYARAIPYKWMTFSASNCPSDHPDCVQSVTLCNKCIHRSELGNIMFGWSGKFAGFSKEILYAGGLAAEGLKETAERATMGLGYAMAEWVLGGHSISSEAELCGFLNNTVDQSAGTFLPGTTEWTWEAANHGQDMDIASCQPCLEQLSPYYGHTVPALSGNPAGNSLFANRKRYRDPFYVDQLPKYVGAPWEGELAEPSLSYLSHELCNDLSHPEDFSRTREFCGFSG